MNLKLFLISSAALLVWILASGIYMLLYYWAALTAMVTFLYTRPAYKQQPYKWLTLLFFCYMLFIVWERTRDYKFSTTTELFINDAEHILFAMIISLLVMLVLSIYTKGKKQAIIIALTVLAFNIVGVLNECFQNLLSARPVFVFIPDSQKDLLMNVLGTGVFILLAVVFWKRRQLKGVG